MGLTMRTALLVQSSWQQKQRMHLSRSICIAPCTSLMAWGGQCVRQIPHSWHVGRIDLRPRNDMVFCKSPQQIAFGQVPRYAHAFRSLEVGQRHADRVDRLSPVILWGSAIPTPSFSPITHVRSFSTG